MRVRVTVEDDGTVNFQDADGRPLSSEWITRAKRQMGDKIRNLIQEACDSINAKVEALATIHTHTPWPHERLRYEPNDFDSPPAKPAMKPHGFLGWLFKRVRSRIDADNAKRLAEFDRRLQAWKAEKALFEDAERARKDLLENRVLTEVDAMEEILEQALLAIEWPRETAVSEEINDGGRVVLLDVDLPEVEDMPKTTASVPGKGYKLSVKEMSATRIQKLYMQHVHAIGFRIIGEVFAVLPNAQVVVLSGFSQRPNKATGKVTDEYLYSVRVKREEWAAINFANLSALDVITALERFELRRDLTKSGMFRPIEPLVIANVSA